MKSKNAEMRGRAPKVGMGEEAPASRQLGNGPQHPHEVLPVIGNGGWKRTQTDARLHRGPGLLGHTKIESTVRYLGVEVDDALEIAEKIEV